jgi:UDP-N-acetylglucosamine 3-dehydrogenase
VGIVGAGAIAQACHFAGYKKDRRAKIVAFADPAEERHPEILGQFGKSIRPYTDHKAMLKNEELDAVSICTPTLFHAQQTIDAFRAGCHVLCEKPMATKLGDADRMIEAARKARRKLMIGFTHRLYTGTQKCREVIKSRKIGKVFMIRVRFAHGGPYPGWAKNAWFYNPKLAAGGALLDMGIHAIDMCHWLIGPIASVQGKTATLIKDIDVDDNALMLLEFENGALGYIEVGWTSRPGFFGIEVYGTKGTLICDYLRGLKLCGAEAAHGRTGTADDELLDPLPMRGGWETEIRHWLDVLDGKTRLEMTGAAGRDALAVALAAYKSSDSGRSAKLG